MNHQVLLASGDAELCGRVRYGLDGSALVLTLAGSAGEVPRLFDRCRYDALIIDLALEAGQGPELLARVSAALPDLPVVVLGDDEQSADGLRTGAVDYVQRGEFGLRLRTALRNALMQGKLRRQVRELARDRRRVAGLESFTGRSPSFLRSQELLERASRMDAAVLLVGEAGCGKARAARALHNESSRAEHPFITVRCDVTSGDLLLAELFGDQHGRPGAFEEAAGGTVYVDRVDRLSEDAQARLLEVLQESHVRRPGESRSIPVNVRIIASTTGDTQNSDGQGLRQDLEYRLSVFPVPVPSLRERSEDIELLALSCLERLANVHGHAAQQIDKLALQALIAHDWPGNLLELEAAIERAVLVAGGECLQLEMFPRQVRSAIVPEEDAAALRLVNARDPLAGIEASDAVVPLEEQEKRILVHALRCTNWNIVETARRLEIGRATVYRKIERFGLSRSSERGVI